MTNKTIVAYKGFNADMTCRGFQFEIGKTFEHDGKVKACASGFHSCENPIDVFVYYAPGESRYCEVELGGDISRHSDDSKIASATITIKAEISMPEFVQRCIDWVWSKIDKSLEQQIMTGNTGYQSAASNTGDYSAASNTGNRSAASNTGYYSAASNTGDYSAASNTGHYSAASNTGDYSAASNTGDYSAASNTGNRSAASNTGDRSAAEVSGSHSVAAAFGIESKARAGESGAIVLCFRDDEGELIHIRASKVGDNGVKANTWYQLDENGEFVEAS
ncbi:DUF7666 domain-containing protein [Lelliottia amnigena]|uniref:DUF7666 domain-containing protein n=1 Tax=Lelliottia amnigena TaxID=61646 RepID=UPI003BA07CE5